GFVDGSPGGRWVIDRRARVQVGGGRVAVAHVEEQHTQRGLRSRPVGKVEGFGAHLVDAAAGEAHLSGCGGGFADTNGAERVLRRAAEQLAAVWQLPLDVDV